MLSLNVTHDPSTVRFFKGGLEMIREEVLFDVASSFEELDFSSFHYGGLFSFWRIFRRGFDFRFFRSRCFGFFSCGFLGDFWSCFLSHFRFWRCSFFNLCFWSFFLFLSGWFFLSLRFSDLPLSGDLHALKPGIHGILAALHDDLRFVALERHVAELLAMNRGDILLISMVVRRAEIFSTHAALANGLEAPLGGFAFDLHFGVKFTTPIGFPEVANGFFFCEPDGVVFATTEDVLVLMFKGDAESVTPLKENFRKIEDRKGATGLGHFLCQEIEAFLAGHEAHAESFRCGNLFTLRSTIIATTTASLKLTTSAASATITSTTSLVAPSATTASAIITTSTTTASAVTGVAAIRTVLIFLGRLGLRLISRPRRAETESGQIESVAALGCLRIIAHW